MVIDFQMKTHPATNKELIEIPGRSQRKRIKMRKIILTGRAMMKLSTAFTRQRTTVSDKLLSSGRLE